MIPSDEKPLIDLQNELLIRIGNSNDNHIISWDILKKLGDSLEDLILTIAKLEAGEKISQDYFKLDFSGFYAGSAIPAFKLSSNEQVPLFYQSKMEALIKVNKTFSLLIKNIDSGNYKAVSDRYENPSIKNEIIKKIYEFTNSAGTKPVNIVERDNNGFKDIYKVRRLQKSIFKQLMVKDGLEEEGVEEEESTAIAKMIIKKKQGKITKKQSELYEDKEAVISLKIDHIDFLSNKYVFNFPVLFQVSKESGGTIIENDQLDIYASGETLTDAKIALFSQFDHSFQRFNFLDDIQLSKKLLKVKQYYNFLVKSVNKI